MSGLRQTSCDFDTQYPVSRLEPSDRARPVSHPRATPGPADGLEAAGDPAGDHCLPLHYSPLRHGTRSADRTGESAIWRALEPGGVGGGLCLADPKTAMAATLAHHRYDNRPLQQFMPRTFVAMEVQLRLVLDLGDGGVCQRLRVSLRRLLGVEPVGPMKLPRSQSEFDPRRDRMRRVQSAPVPDLGESMPRSDQAWPARSIFDESRLICIEWTFNYTGSGLDGVSEPRDGSYEPEKETRACCP